MPTNDLLGLDVPQDCALPTIDRPLRVVEFDELFQTSVREVERLSPTRLRMLLDPSAEARARDLTSREAQCCSFFNFTFAAGATALRLQIDVPASRVEVLDSVAERACAALAMDA
ncbi:MAG: hypothetical protein WKF51_01130 [Geodermatophilaceae bacterium]